MTRTLVRGPSRPLTRGLTRASLDPDAAAYIALSGATDAVAIDGWVRGMKNLGYYANMVCWPLRSSQNAGTGTTAYSLGNQATAPATLINGPTWGAAGIACESGLAQSLATGSVLTGAANMYLFTVLSTDRAGESSGVPVQIGFGGVALSLQSNSTVVARTASPSLNKSGLTSSPEAFGAKYTASSKSLSRNGGNVASVAHTITMPSAYASTIAQGAVNGSGFSTNAFAMIINQDVTDELAIYNLYKSTLGAGLGLP